MYPEKIRSGAVMAWRTAVPEPPSDAVRSSSSVARSGAVSQSLSPPPFGQTGEMVAMPGQLREVMVDLSPPRRVERHPATLSRPRAVADLRPRPGAHRRTGQTLAGAVAKRAFDITFALVLLVLAIPLLVAIGLVVRLTSPGPIFFRQVRCGHTGRTFVLYKFRTMVDGADRLTVHLDQALREAYADGWKLMNDPRITGIGNLLRRTSLDELPQLFNVLRGQMSVVGPRPVQVDELRQEYGEHAVIFDQVKPGLTGLWQVSGRSALTYAQRIALDLEYVERRSFWFDLLLVVRTIPVLVFGRGAV